MSFTNSFRILEKRQETHDTITFVLQPLTEDFHYLAGQFLTFLLNINGKEVRRSYSFCTSAIIDPFPAVTIKRVANGEVSRHIHHYWNVGDVVTALPPAGRFIIEKKAIKRDIFFLVAGSGITPAFALIKQLVYNEKETKVHLLYSNKNKSETIFHDELIELEKQFPEQLQITFFFSQSKFLYNARLSKGLLEEITKTKMTFNKKDALFFICGPYEYMQMANIVLTYLHFAADQIKQERFETIKTDTQRFTISDKTSKKVTVFFQNKKHEFTVAYPETILDAALKQDIQLPYSCHSGQCGACTAKCISGKVAMHYNEILTDGDEKKGLILTCTGHPLEDTIIEV